MVAASDTGRALGVLGVFCLLRCFGFISCISQQTYGILHKNVTFHVPSNIPLTEILWKKQKDKVAERENSEFRAFSSFKNRVYLDTVSGSLTIYNLTLSDEDEYEMESPNITDTMKFFLYVLGHSRHRYVLIPVALALIVTCVVLYVHGTRKCGRKPDRSNSN
ncbi:PREDICTED: lymphocyte function-associated antigen 3 isoform X2 [Mandrillus leucophaeus]|uniref:lymphocyte function-associated antigen 3 isoform X2 n=1 Tax=Mandrillus leucophaeus TaxID=9568 RepID=UPI0005F50E8A|nr:PREDICTED: lymphocyte function-associated antigen 3 isoform X2 [Mandrillus leucophaeus]